MQLIGRTAELAAIDDALAALRRRRSGVVEFVGDPGIGKTRLLRELEARAAALGQLVLSGSASEIEGGLPFGMFVDALEEHVERHFDALDVELRDHLRHVFPSLGGPERPSLQDERYRTHRAMRRLLDVLAQPKPLVLALDDIHWADAGSIDLLGALLRRPPAEAVLIAVTVRPRQIPERLQGALAGVTSIPVGALSAEEAGELIGTDLASAFYEESAGNPFYLEQLARAPVGAAGGLTSLAGVEVPRGVALALTS
jgi:predicted ATPase